MEYQTEYLEFLETIVHELSMRVRGKVTVHRNQIIKNNRSPIDSITIRMEGENAAPAIHTEPFFRQYLSGLSMEEVVNQVLTYHFEHKISGYVDVDAYLDFEKVKANLICRIVNYEKNRELLKEIPHRRFLNLAVVYYHKMEHPVFGKASVLIRNSHLEVWKISLKELEHAAEQNTREEGMILLEISAMVEELTGNRLDKQEAKECQLYPMYVMTNPERAFGAVNMIFRECLDQIAEQIGGDFYLLPSSIHECMIVPDDDALTMDAEEMKQMVREINSELVAEEEVLADSVYRYYHERKLLALAS